MPYSTPIIDNGNMELIVFSGIQCSGKSTFYLQKFSDTHARINLDILRTRKRELALFSSLLEEMRPMVIDNTNPAIEDRSKYIRPAQNKGYRIIGYRFDTPISIALARSSSRLTQRAIPEIAIHSTLRKMEPLSISEGFHEIFVVRFRLDLALEVIRQT